MSSPQLQAYLPVMALGSYSFKYGPTQATLDTETNVATHPIINAHEQTEAVGTTSFKVQLQGFVYSTDNSALIDMFNFTASQAFRNRPVCLSLFTQDRNLSQLWFSGVGYLSNTHFEYNGGYAIYKYPFRLNWIEAFPVTYVPFTNVSGLLGPQSYSFNLSGLPAGYVAGVRLTAPTGSTSFLFTAQSITSLVEANDPQFNGTNLIIGQSPTLGGIQNKLFTQLYPILAGPPFPYLYIPLLDNSGNQSVALGQAPTGTYTVNFSQPWALAPTNVELVYVPTGSYSPPAGVRLSVSVLAVPTTANAGAQIQFTATATGGAGGYSYAWNFGDGSNGTGATPTHAYSAASTYTASCTVTDSSGNTGSASIKITVAAITTVKVADSSHGTDSIGQKGFTATLSANPTSAQQNALVQFTTTITSAVGKTPYYYQLQANYGSGWNTVQTGNNSASTWVISSDSWSATGTVYMRTVVNDSSNPANSTTTNQVQLTITSIPTLTASASSSPNPALTNQTVQFTGSASGGVSPYTFLWDFGDGGTGNGSAVSHTYTAAGVYPVILTVKDNNATQVTAQINETVNAPPPPPPQLTATIGESSLTTRPNSSISFTGSAVNGTTPYSWSWNFGDGGTSTVQNPSHSWTAVGNYTVTLTVKDSASPQNTATASVVIQVGNQF